MYDWEFTETAKAQLGRLPYGMIDDLVETMALVCADPWNFQRQPDEPLDDHHAHRVASFGDGGLVMFLILEHAAEVHVTRITWVG